MGNTDCPYKEDSALNTINKIQNILHCAGISTSQTNWLDNMNKFFSCSIQLNGTNIQSHGKGLSREYCLASGYGEFIERLQNRLVFNNIPFRCSAYDKFGFSISPEEKKQKSTFLPPSFKNAVCIEENQNLYELYKNRVCERTESENSHDLYVPYYSVFEDKIVDLPYYFMLQFYGSNGMSAGNTHPESIVQGISEILERYVTREIYFNNIVPPVIDDLNLNKFFKDEYELIKEIEKEGNYKIVVRDCSLGKKIPVIAIVFYDLKENKVAIKFGSEPDVRIGLQRCLTELFQGMELTYNYKAVPFDLGPFDFDNSIINFKNIVCTGVGRMPNSFFMSTSDYEFEYSNIQFSSIEEKLDYFISIIKSLGAEDLFIRDVSFLEFPTHQVIIPGFSEIFSAKAGSKMDKSEISKIDKSYYLSNLRTLSDSELFKLAMSLESFYAVDMRSQNFQLAEWYKIPIYNKEWEKITLELLLSMIYYKLKKYKKSAENLGIYIQFVKNNFTAQLDYYYCMKEYIQLKDELEDSLILEILRNNFDLNIVNLVAEDLSDSNKIFDYIPLPNYWKCESCVLKANCNYEAIEDAFLSIKKKQIENPIDQSDLKSKIKGNSYELSR